MDNTDQKSLLGSWLTLLRHRCHMHMSVNGNTGLLN
jgi:hypothetical protein